MMCYGCNNILSDNEILLNNEEDFIDNKCLCSECLSWSNGIWMEDKKDE